MAVEFSTEKQPDDPIGSSGCFLQFYVFDCFIDHVGDLDGSNAEY